VENYAATQQERLLHSVSGGDAGAKSKDYRNDSTGSVGWRTTIKDKPPSHSSSGVQNCAGASLPHDSQNRTCLLSDDHSPRSETHDATCPLVKNYAADHSSVENVELIQGTSSPESCCNVSDILVFVLFFMQMLLNLIITFQKAFLSTPSPAQVSRPFENGELMKSISWPPCFPDRLGISFSNNETLEGNASFTISDSDYIPSKIEKHNQRCVDTKVRPSKRSEDSISYYLEDIRKHVINIERMQEREMRSIESTAEESDPVQKQVSKRKRLQKNEDERKKWKKSDLFNECDRCCSEINKLKSIYKTKMK
jgi:hypothetical protein